MFQWLGVCSFTAEGPGSIPGWGTKILQTVQWGQGKKLHFLVSILKSTIHEVIVWIPESVILNSVTHSFCYQLLYEYQLCL